MGTASRNRGILAALVFVVALIGLALYWPTIRLPLIYDDLLHIRITKELDLASVWLPTDSFGFYRPLTFLPLLIIRGLFGSYPSELLHGLNIIQHAANAALVGALSWRLWRRVRWAFAAGLLFVFFPFSFQAVAVYGHNVHPTTTGLILAGLHAYLSALRSSDRARLWWLITINFFILGLLSHESAILFGALAALVHLNHEGQLTHLKLRQPGAFIGWSLRSPWFLFLVAGAIYALLYQFLDLSRSPQASFSPGSPWYKALYLAQGAAYPITWFGRWIPANESAVTLLVLAGLGLMVALSVWSGRDAENRLPLLLGWVWWLLASLLVALPLDANYLLHGPRLLYLGSVGLAFLWPVLLEPVTRLGRYGWLAWIGLLVLVLVSNGFYIKARIDDYASLTEPVTFVEERLEGVPSAEGVVLVNLPQWIDRLDNNYRVGVDLVAMMGDYLFVEELIEENLNEPRPARAIVAPELLSQSGYNYGLHEGSYEGALAGDWAAEGSHFFISSYLENGIETRYTGMIAPARKQEQPLAFMGPYDLLNASALVCRGQLELSATWRLAGGNGQGATPAPTTSIFAQLIDNRGQITDQQDGPLLGLGPDLLNLPAGWLAVDNRNLSADKSAPERLLLGVYDYGTGERYQAFDQEGSRLVDDALEIPWQTCLPELD